MNSRYSPQNAVAAMKQRDSSGNGRNLGEKKKNSEEKIRGKKQLARTNETWSLHFHTQIV